MYPFATRMMMGAANAAPWTPAQLGATLKTWFDADDDATFSNGSATNISQWRDKSAGGYVATPNGTPYRVASGQNGRTVVRCDASYLVTTGDHFITGNVARTMVIAWKPREDPINRPLLGVGAAANNQAFAMNTQGDLYRYAADIRLGSPSNGVPNIMAGWHDGSVTRGEFNGTLASGSVSSAAATVPSRFGINTQAVNATNTSLPTTDIYEVLVCDTALNQANRDKLVGYLAWKWGIQGQLPIGHAYKSAAPLV